MDTTLPHRIVLVVATFPDGENRGTGLRLKTGWILTSQHLVDLSPGGQLQEAEKVEVFLARGADGETRSAPAKVRWRGERELDTDNLRHLDAALLEEDGPLPKVSGEEILFVASHLPSGDCETAGWRQGSLLTDRLVTPDPFSGKFTAIVETATVLPLQIEGLEPANYGGMSGAPVFVSSGPYRGKLYGVIRKGPKVLPNRLVDRPDQLLAVSTPALLRQEEFRELLGIQDPAPPHENLILESRRLLTRRPHLAERLAGKDDKWRAAWEADGESGGVDGLLSELSKGGEFRQVLDILEVMSKEVSEGREEIEDLQQWAGHLTALFARSFVATKQRRLERHGGRVKVPLGSPNYAEAVLAADHGEAPRYERRGGEAQPVLQVPASHLEAGIRQQKRSEDQISRLEDQLLRKDLATPRYLSEIELDIIEGAQVQEQSRARLQAIQSALEEYGTKVGGQKARRPYLLVTPKLRKQDINGVLTSFLAYLEGILPQLEQVEIRGEPGESLQLERELKPLWRILGIDKETGEWTRTGG